MYLSIALIIFTCIISYKGLKDEFFLDRFSFRPEKVRINKEYVRLVSSGFLHVNWIHLAINMFVLFSFGNGLEVYIGWLPFLVIYFTSLVGGNLLALWIHKYNAGYNSVGASGAISGLVFATIALQPQMNIFFLPGWVFGIAYVLYTIYAIRSQRTDVGHAAHLGGALIGMAFAILMFPGALIDNWIAILAIFLPGVALIIIMIRKPELILVDKRDQRKALSKEDVYNMDRNKQKLEVDRILEKINERGINSLTRKERDILDDFSRS